VNASLLKVTHNPADYLICDTLTDSILLYTGVAYFTGVKLQKVTHRAWQSLSML